MDQEFWCLGSELSILGDFMVCSRQLYLSTCAWKLLHVPVQNEASKVRENTHVKTW